MNNDKLEGVANDAAGRVKSAVGDLTGDSATKAEGEAQRLGGQARQAVGDAKQAVSEAAGTVEEQIAGLRAQVESLLNERVKPAVGAAVERAEVYAAEAGEYISAKAGDVGATVKQQPLLALLTVGVVGFVLGRLAGQMHDR